MNENTAALCDNCIHRDVCKLRDDYKAVREALDNVMVNLPKKDHDRVFQIKLRDIPWINPVVAVCQHHKL